MKRLLLSGILVTLSLSLVAQQNSFKSVTKRQKGTLPDITISRFIKGKPSSKGVQNGFVLPKSLKFPAIPDKNYNINKIILRNSSPVFIERKCSESKSSLLSDEDKFYKFFEDIKATTKISDQRGNFTIAGIRKDEFGITHINAFQRYKGVRIYGSEFSLHISTTNERFTGRIYNIDNEINTIPNFSHEEIIDIIEKDIKSLTIWKDLSAEEKQILHYDYPSPGLVIMKHKGYFALAYDVEIRPNFLEVWRYFIDACTGEILKKYNSTCSDGPATATAIDLNGISRSLNTYLENGRYYLMDIAEPMFNFSTQEGMIITLDANNTSTTDLDYNIVTSNNNTWNIPSSVSAHYNATTAYRCYYNLFGRNSINGNGGDIISLINVAEDDGTSMENAFWNGYAVFYGNGGSNFKPLAGALDVASHELGHGIVSNTANLEYYGQSGAVNESYADIFGSTVDSLDWYIGEDITMTSFSPSGALRDMADPHNLGSSLNDPYWQPKHVSEMYIGEGDNGGVHINNGIGNHAYYLFATSVSSRKKAATIFYNALTTYLTSTSQFIDFRIAVIQAATDKYGAGSPEAVKAAEAFDAVGIYEEEQVNQQQDYELNSGSEYLLSYDTNESEPNTLYKSTISGTNFEALTTTQMKRRVSVTDDGVYIVFVDTDGYIKGISQDPYSPGEFSISEDPYWDNVAISKDGNRIAAISIDIDTAIYVFDMSQDPVTFRKFMLYNPTTSHSNTTAGGVLYADAIEFDHTGENLIYDAFNVLNSSTDEDIEYWDIGFINVWDNQKNDFGNGAITKLYGSLPDYVSIGNPVFSKNSPYIIAFDYLDEYNDEYAILGVNLATGDLGVLAYNSTVGFPSYSIDDTQLSYSALTTSDEEVIAVRSLSTDKINGTGDASILINDARWPVYYASGSRDLELQPLSNFTVDYKAGNAPLTVQFFDLSTNDPTSWSWTFTGGTPPSSTLQNPVVVYNTPGTFAVALTASRGSLSNTNTKTEYITVTTPTAIDDSGIKETGFYPNPVTSLINIRCNSEFTVEIFTISGNLILQSKNENTINLSGIKSGLYIIEIKTPGGSVIKKLVKE
ncbi:MAG: M4 family metallopeptidase [Bacteroidales bacterium]|nr:M4 family metallopeptidase [Bacteroidales bacterium]